MSYFINTSGYKFSNLTNLDDLQKDLLACCQALALKGTILLSEEGINLFLCGTRENINAFYQRLTELGFPPMDFKESLSEDVPFKRMLVKIKAEIITMGVPEINPAQQNAPSLSAECFKQWLDEGKPMVILDARNTYEINIGKFKNALHLNIENFRDFPDAVKQLPNEYKDQTIVTYCTGGIRCEKAAPYLMAQGFKDVYQLDGGILKYLEKCANAHYDGECFVFDERIAVDARLQPTQAKSGTTQRSSPTDLVFSVGDDLCVVPDFAGMTKDDIFSNQTTGQPTWD